MPPEFEIDEQDLKELREGYETDTDAHSNSGGREGGDGRDMIFARSPPPPLTLENTKLFFNDPERPNPRPNYIVTAGLDGTIRLWHVSSGLCLRTFFGHLEGIWSIKADNLRIVSTSEDGMVKVWCPHSGMCERTFIGHQGPVTCVSLTAERLITGGEDCEIRILSFGEDVGNSQKEKTRQAVSESGR
jgi:F-box/WD-40 domain protein MET30